MINMPGGPELLVIFLVALVVIGPHQLPKAMRTFGNVMAEVRKVSSSFQAEMKSAMDSVVDTTASEKPQSGTMATPTTTVAEPVAPTVSDDADEVVARHDGDTAAAAGSTVGAWSSGGFADDVADVDDATSSSDPAAPAAPAIDPADRAAG